MRDLDKFYLNKDVVRGPNSHQPLQESLVRVNIYQPLVNPHLPLVVRIGPLSSWRFASWNDKLLCRERNRTLELDTAMSRISPQIVLISLGSVLESLILALETIAGYLHSHSFSRNSTPGPGAVKNLGILGSADSSFGPTLTGLRLLSLESMRASYPIQ
jgi:hypothetical protein